MVRRQRICACCPDAIPAWLEQAFLILGGVWFVNLVNFMDGLDWITVAEMVPVTALRRPRSGSSGICPSLVALVAAALCGALLGFAPFNKPVARLFLGDVGSLPIGLLVGWMLLQLAGTGALAAAILLPLYYLMDATITLLRRLARGEKVWEAHRSHFYQKATDNGFSALEVSAHVFGLNLALAGLAAVTLALAVGRGADRGAYRGRRSRRPAFSGALRRRPILEVVPMNAPLIALTGATGFIGRHLLARAAEARLPGPGAAAAPVRGAAPARRAP